MRSVSGVLETCVYADDLDAASRFYGDVLGLDEFSSAPGRHVFFRCGQAMFLVFDPRRTGASDSAVPPHGARGPGHVCFAVREEEIDDWRNRLDRAGVTIEAEVAWPRGGRSLYVRDPAGNSVELATPTIWGLT